MNKDLHKFKVHGADTVDGEWEPGYTGVFYGSLDAAIRAATKFTRREGADMVIFEAVKVVRLEGPPVKVEDINDDET